MNKLIIATAILLLNVSYTSAAPVGEKQLFRYVNAQGNTVIDSAIPPQYVASGYEVIAPSGKVLRVVPPALSKEEAEAQRKAIAAQERRKKEDLQLRRSYSSVDDIEAAKIRNLQTLKSNIALLENNLEATRKRLETAKVSAASIERTGKDAPETLLKTISGFEQEERDILALLEARNQEMTAIEEKFEADKIRLAQLLAEMAPAQ